MLFMRKTTALPSAAEALPGRAQPIPTATSHFVNGRQLQPPYPAVWSRRCSGLAASGVRSVNSGNSATASLRTAVAMPAVTPPTRLMKKCARAAPVIPKWCWWCSIPKKISYDQLLKTFWESHNPTQGMRQGNDVGTQYRSAIYTFSDAQRKAVDASKAAYQKALAAKGLGAITTEIAPAGEFYFAEDYHQQYLAKNPAGYCGLGGTGVSCPIGAGVSA